MEISNNILNELKELSPIVAGIQKVNVFTVPAGYFESLTEDILVGIKIQEGGLPDFISTPSANINVPQGYFETLAGNILNKIKEEESVATELKVLSPTLHSIENKNVFTVPQGYFKAVHNIIVSKINKEETAAELKGLSPVLYSIKDKNVYTVPDNYFETLADKIVNAAKPKQAKLVTMRKRTAVILKYAAAAVFTGAMALGVYKFAGSKTGVDPVIAQGWEIAKENKFDDELAKVTDADIVQYLEDNGSDTDAALVASSTINEDELPTQDDYLTDDKALDKYLDNIDVNDLKN
jgi:hypothetical protein